MFDISKKVRLTTKLHSFSKAKVQLFLIGGYFFGDFRGNFIPVQVFLRIFTS